MTPPARIERAIFRVADLESSVDYYRALGMSALEPDSNELRSALLAFPDDPLGANIELRQDRSRDRPTGRSSYWKIGITVDDLDRTRQNLQANGVETSAPHRFEDVGYLCHASDPDGFAIEILQRTFDSPAGSAPAGAPGPPRLAHVTYRVNHLERSLELLCGHLGMSVNGQLTIDSHDFTLTFLSWENRTAPADLDPLAATQWLWQRPHTLVELWHSPGAGEGLEHDPGFGGIVVSHARDAGTLSIEGYSVAFSRP